MLELVSNFTTLPNVWLGTSVENEDYLGRIEILRRVPARVRFVSFEPLLGPIRNPDLRDIHWAIVGGESGEAARPMQEWWVEELHAACARQQVAFFFKQWGGKRKKRAGRLFKNRTWDAYPDAAARV
jgi:protein gp37